MPVPRAYVDTSVFGGTQDDQFSDTSRRFFRDATNGRFVVLISPETLRELQDAPAEVRRALAEFPPESVEIVQVTPEVEALANAYIAAGVLGQGHRADAIHVAAASVARADLIVSWNFRHIVNLNRIRMYNGVNAIHGYSPVEIRSPLDLSCEDEDKGI